MNAVTLTANELAVLKALRVSAAGNGDDFGYIEDARKVLPNAASLGGVVASLSTKGLITVWDAVTTDSGRWTQFTWDVETEVIEELIK